MNFFSFETWVGLRYLRSRKNSGFISFIGIISIISIALGVMTLIVVISVMNGFQKELRLKLFQIAPHMEISYYDIDQNKNYKKLEEIIKQNKNVVATSPFISNQVLLSNSGIIKGTEVIGIDNSFLKVVDNPEEKNNPNFKNLTDGSFNIILGEDLAYSLNLNIGDKVTIISPEGNVTPVGFVPRLKQFTLVGIVKSKNYELNNTLARINIHDAQKIFKLSNTISGIRVKLKHPEKAPELVNSILPEDIRRNVGIYDWSFKNKSYFEAVALEKKMMYLIMALITIVASFNLVSSLIMTVNEKKSDISILRTIGFSPASIMKIFFIQGSVAGFTGIFFGLISGLIIADNISIIIKFIENIFHKQFIKSEIYFLDYLPSDIQLYDVITITAIASILVLIATLYPSWKASLTKPAEALRYE